MPTRPRQRPAGASRTPPRRRAAPVRPPSVGAGSDVEMVRVRVRVRRRRSRWKRLTRRWLPRALGALVVLLVLAGAWVVARGLEARQKLTAASTGVAQVRTALLAGDPAGASRALEDVAADARSARDLTHDPIWSLAAHVPFVGRSVRTVSGVTGIADDLTHVTFPDLIRTAGVVSSQRIKLDHGSVDLAVLGQQAAPLTAADVAVARDVTVARDLPDTWLAPASKARARLLEQLVPLSSEVHAAAVTAEVGPSMLGRDGPRTYFVAFQNSAEARGTGGIAGAYVILRAEGGTLHVESKGSDADLRNDLGPTPKTAGSPRFDNSGANQDWRNANTSADFTAAAQTWVSLWQEQHGEHLDGAFAVDPQVLSYLLAVTGPATLSNGQVVDAGNAVSLTEQAVYASYGTDRGNRQSFLQLVSSATVDKVLAAPASSGTDLLQALRRAAGEHRLLLFSGTAVEEQRLLTTPAGGGLPPTSDPTAIMALVNASGNKVDYYVRSDLRYRATSCAGSTRTATVTYTVTNDAPTSGLSDVVGGRLDGKAGPPGSETANVSYYATAGAQVASVTLDGKPWTVNVDSASGHPVFTTSVDLLPGGGSHTLVLNLVEPVLSGPVQTRPQALVAPQSVTVDAPVCRS